VLLVKGIRQHFVEQDTGYERFKVDAEAAKVGAAEKP